MIETIPYPDIPLSPDFKYPDYFTVTIDHFETGLGLTQGYLVMTVSSADALRDGIIERFGSYFSQGADIRQGVHLIKEFDPLIPAKIRKVLMQFKKDKRPRSTFAYLSYFHENFA